MKTCDVCEQENREVLDVPEGVATTWLRDACPACLAELNNAGRAAYDEHDATLADIVRSAVVRRAIELRARAGLGSK